MELREPCENRFISHSCQEYGQVLPVAADNRGTGGPLGMDIHLLPWMFAPGWGIFEGFSIGPFYKLDYRGEMTEGCV